MTAPDRTSRSRRVRRAVSATLLSASMLAAPSALAQRGTDLGRHVNVRLRGAVTDIGACATNAPAGTSLPSTIELEASVRGRFIDVRLTEGNFPPAVVQCIEQRATAAVAMGRSDRFDQQGNVRIRIPFLVPRPAAPPTSGPIVPPPPPPPSSSLVVGQPIEVEWGGQWYAARVVRLDRGGRVLIHYDGWSDAWDESVPFTRVRLVAAPPPVQPPVVYPQPPPPPPVYPQPPVVYPQPPPPPPPVFPQPGYDGNLLVNGGFEQHALAQGSWQMLPQIPGWFVTSGQGFEVQAGAAGTPFEGRQLLELDGNAPTSIAQDVNVQPGVTYELRIAFSARPNTAPEDNRILVLFDGRPVGRLQADGRGNPDTRWTVYSAWVTANGPRARLEIRDEGTPNSTGSYVDDVRLVPAR